MTLAPFLAAPALVQAHAALAIVALLIGIVVMAMPKGTPLHLNLGRVWAGLMLLTAALSFGVTGIKPGHFSAIHILSVVTLVAIPVAIWRRRRGDIRGHARGMIGAFLGLLIAGLFTLSPGRVMHAVFFGG